MKKIYLLIAIVVLTATAIQAQTYSRWGITAGANINTIQPAGYRALQGRV